MDAKAKRGGMEWAGLMRTSAHRRGGGQKLAKFRGCLL